MSEPERRRTRSVPLADKAGRGLKLQRRVPDSIEDAFPSPTKRGVD